MDNSSFVIERTYNTPISEVWNAITKKEEMKKWYFDLAEFNAEVGFEFQFLGGPDEKKYLHLCKVTEVIPGRKITYSWRYDGYEGNSFVTFELFDENPKTRLKLTRGWRLSRRTMPILQKLILQAVGLISWGLH